MGRKQFTFYESFYSALRRIRKKADRADAYDAIANYALLGQEPDLDSLPDAAAIAFELIRPTLDASVRKAESGRTGGQRNRKETEQPDGDSPEKKPETRNPHESKPEANRKQSESKPEADAKQSESEGEKENEIEIEDECRRRRAHAREPDGGNRDGGLCDGLTGTDLTHEIEQSRHAQALIRRYGLPDSEATLCALIDDFAQHGVQTVEKALAGAALSDRRGGMSIAYYRAVLKNAGKPWPAAGEEQGQPGGTEPGSPPGEWQGTNGRLETYW